MIGSRGMCASWKFFQVFAKPLRPCFTRLRSGPLKRR
jgi:hypothetical protein